MTVIVWDGKTLAADKLADSAGIRRTVTKIQKVNGCLVGTSGNFARGLELIAWWRRGAITAELPAYQHLHDEFVDLLVISPDKGILKWERSPVPMIFEDTVFAMGSGRDFALAALHYGATAAEAVEVACKFDLGCGIGVDILTFD